MGVETAIGWTDHTFNPWWGCERVSPGCQHCYAEAFAKRTGNAVWRVAALGVWLVPPAVLLAVAVLSGRWHDDEWPDDVPADPFDDLDDETAARMWGEITRNLEWGQR